MHDFTIMQGDCRQGELIGSIEGEACFVFAGSTVDDADASQQQAGSAQTLCDLGRIVAHCRSQRANYKYLFEEHIIRHA